MTADERDMPARYASSPCLAGEVAPDYFDPLAVDPEQARDVARWRRAERTRLRNDAAVALLIGPEEQARIFQSAGADDKMIGGNGPGPLAARPEIGSRHPRSVAFQIGRHGVHHQRHMGRILQEGPIFLADMDCRTLDELDPVDIFRHGHVRAERYQVQHVPGRIKERLEVLSCDGPAGIGYPVALLEVVGIELAAPTGPMIGATTQQTDTRHIKVKIGIAINRSAVEILAFLGDVLAARF